MITVPNRKVLDVLPNKPAQGEYAIVQDEGKIYTFDKNTWTPVNIQSQEGGLQVSLYDINQNIFAQLKPMTDEALRQVHAQVFKFLGDSMQNEFDDYWALVCWKRKYITIFHHNAELKHAKDSEELSDIFMEIIENLGDVKDVSEVDGQQALEIWITDDEGTECYVLFNYAAGIVEGIA